MIHGEGPWVALGIYASRGLLCDCENLADGSFTALVTLHCIGQGDKTDNDHERISPNSTMPSLSSVPGPAASAVAETGGAEQAAAGDLVKQLQEKDRRIQYLELKIQQLSQVRWLPPTHHLRHY